MRSFLLQLYYLRRRYNTKSENPKRNLLYITLIELAIIGNSRISSRDYSMGFELFKKN